MDITVCIVGQKPSKHLLASAVCLVELHLLHTLSSPSYLLLELTLCMVSKYITVHPWQFPQDSFIPFYQGQSLKWQPLDILNMANINSYCVQTCPFY